MSVLGRSVMFGGLLGLYLSYLHDRKRRQVHNYSYVAVLYMILFGITASTVLMVGISMQPSASVIRDYHTSQSGCAATSTVSSAVSTSFHNASYNGSMNGTDSEVISMEKYWTPTLLCDGLNMGYACMVAICMHLRHYFNATGEGSCFSVFTGFIACNLVVILLIVGSWIPVTHDFQHKEPNPTLQYTFDVASRSLTVILFTIELFS